MWIPPGFSFVTQTAETNNNINYLVIKHDLSELGGKEKDYLYHSIADKRDCLFAAYLVAGGIKATLRFLQWLGQPTISTRNSESEQSDPKTTLVEMERFNQSQNLVFAFDSYSNLLISSASGSFQAFNLPSPGDTVPPKLLECILQVREVIGWEFQDPSQHLQSLTHSSFQEKIVTGSYERLEFLADAVLDCLFTAHL